MEDTSSCGTRRPDNRGKLPDADGKMRRGLFLTKYGFGFDESCDDYKVFGILSGFCSAGRYETVVSVYSLRADSWKRVEGFKDGLPFDDIGKFMSGRLHWGKRAGLSSKWDIVYFDLETETYGTIEQPRHIQGGGFSPSLGVVGGCLSMLCDFPGVSLDVWVLKHYGVKESWDKLVSVPYNNFDNPWKGQYSSLLCIGPKGGMLLVYGSSFVVYDSEDNRFKDPEMVNFGPFLEADVYVESLVLLSR